MPTPAPTFAQTCCHSEQPFVAAHNKHGTKKGTSLGLFWSVFRQRLNKLIWQCDKGTTGRAAALTSDHQCRHMKQSLPHVTAVNYVTTPAHALFLRLQPAAKIQRNTTSIHMSDRRAAAIMFISIWSPCLYTEKKCDDLVRTIVCTPFPLLLHR